MSAFKQAIAIVGSQAALARSIGVKQAHIWNWLNKKSGEVPPQHVIPISMATENKVTPHDLRPDIYPNPTDGLPSGAEPQPVTAGAE